MGQGCAIHRRSAGAGAGAGGGVAPQIIPPVLWGVGVAPQNFGQDT